MKFELDPVALNEIAQETRRCFLEEDVPLYLNVLEVGVQHGIQQHYDGIDFKEMMRAAHSLKGGAGLANLYHLSALSHQLETVLEKLEHQEFDQPEPVWSLLEWGVNEIALITEQAQLATVDQDIEVSKALLDALALVLPSAPSSAPSSTLGGNGADSSMEEQPEQAAPSAFVQRALTTDLEACLTRMETLDPGESLAIWREELEGFADECTLLGEALKLDWLVEPMEQLMEVLDQTGVSEVMELQVLGQYVTETIRSSRDQYLNRSTPELEINPQSGSPRSGSPDLTSITTEPLVLDPVTTPLAPEQILSLFDHAPEGDLPLDTEPMAIASPVDPDLLAPVALESSKPESLKSGQLNLKSLEPEPEPELLTHLSPNSPDPGAEVSVPIHTNLVEPVSHSPQGTKSRDDETNLTGDSAVIVAPLQSPTQSPSQAASQKTASPPQPAPEPAITVLRVPLQRLENMASTTGELILSHERLRLQQQQLQQTSQRLRNLTRQLDPLREEVQTIYDQLSIAGTSSPSLVNSIHSPLQATNRDQNGTTPIPETVNSLGLAQYSDIHSSLQQFQELMVQVQEARADIDLIARDLHEDLDQTQRHLDGLYDEITQARLVPFRTLAQRFPKQLHHLSLQYGKSVAVVLEGEEVLVDQVLLERLQTPLTHLLNNAFDHGIELPRSRQDQGKPEQATIHLSATIDNNTLVVRVTDDGQGINLGKVYAKAQHQGLCDPQRTFESFQTDEILDWIFQPRFSTADTVSVLSGRGVGLDIVREQVRRLRGTIQVSTQPHQGTTFTLRLPLSLSWLSLLLCQFQNYAVAIPSTSILETLPYNELDWLDTPTPRANWRQQSAQVTSLSSLLFPTLGGMESETPRVAIVLEGNNGPLIVSVDTLLGERQLILKPLDDTVTPPPYLVGCTILGSGQVVPVILPQAFETMPTLEPGTPPPPETPQTQIPTIMVVEDSVATRQMLERLLSEVGLQVVVCRDGKEALQALSQRRGQVDLVISDVEMPKVNGFELLQRIRSQADWSQIPVVMATSKTSPEYQQRAMDLGATGYLGKPIQPQQLFDVIQQTLSSGIE